MKAYVLPLQYALGKTYAFITLLFVLEEPYA